MTIKKDKEGCEHKWVLERTDYVKIEGTYNDTFKKINTYFCEKCLGYIEKTVKNESHRGRPYWFNK